MSDCAGAWNKLVDHGRAHGLHGCTHADETARRRHTLLFDIIGLFCAARNNDLDNGFSVYHFGCDVVQTKGGGQKIVPNALRDLLLQGICVLNADNCAIVRNADYSTPPSRLFKKAQISLSNFSLSFSFSSTRLLSCNIIISSHEGLVRQYGVFFPCFHSYSNPFILLSMSE